MGVRFSTITVRFIRGKGAPDKRVRGSGIGLALVLRIAKSHRDSAWVESEPGKGASFFLTLPLRNAPDRDAGSKEQNVKPETASISVQHGTPN